MSSILDTSIGKYVLVRSKNEGINAGYMEAADKTGCVLTDARRLWYHKPKDSGTAWYEGVSQSGFHEKSKISCPVIRKYIIESYSVTECSQKAIDSIKSHPNYES